MLVLGLILILLSVGALVGVLASGADDQAVLYEGNLEVPTLAIFLAGAAALLVFVTGLQLVLSGARRANNNRKSKQRLRKLEKREELRRDDRDAPGTYAETEPRPEPGTGGAQGQAEPRPSSQQSPGPPGDEPYQTPPPPSR
jgi:hypothetical protein